MKPEVLGNTVYWYDKSKLLRNFLIATVFVGGAVWAISTSDKAGGYHQILWWLCAGLFGFLGLANLRKLLTTEPAVVISTTGILLPDFAAEIVPWLAVHDLRRVQNGRLQSIWLRIDPTVAKSLRKNSVRRFLHYGFQSSPPRAAILLGIVQGDPDTVFQRCVDALEVAREAQRIELADAGLPPPLAQESIETPALKRGKPLFTYTLIALLGAIYFGELTFGIGVQMMAPLVSEHCSFSEVRRGG